MKMKKNVNCEDDKNYSTICINDVRMLKNFKKHLFLKNREEISNTKVKKKSRTKVKEMLWR